MSLFNPTNYSSFRTNQAGTNSITAFGIDALNPARLNMIGKPISSGGEFPTSLAINRAGNRICVVNGGKINGVR
jgi:hypothetical protein